MLTHSLLGYDCDQCVELTSDSRRNEGPWTLQRNGESNEEYVKENSPTTYPWGFSDKHFNPPYHGGSSEGIDLDYFVEKEGESKM